MFLFAACFGCGGEPEGPPRAAISGSVSFDGDPIEKGTIRFIPTAGTPGSDAGGPIENGRYSLDDDNGPAVGTNRVEVRAIRKTGRQIEAVPPATGTTDETEQYIPPQYNAESTLTVDVQPGSNEKDFALRSRGG